MHDSGLPYSDEGAVLTQAAKILRGGTYYADIDAYPFPGAPYALALGFRLFGEHLDVARGMAAGVHLAILLAVYACALQLVGARRAALIGVLLLSFKFLAWPALTNYFYWDLAFAFAATSIALLLGHGFAGIDRRLLGAGCAAGLALCTKQSLGIYLALASALVVLFPHRFGAWPSAPLRDRLRALLGYTAGVALPVLSMMLYFTVEGVLPEMLYSGLIRPFTGYLPSSGLSFGVMLRWWELGAFQGVQGLPYLPEPLWTMLIRKQFPGPDWYGAYWKAVESFSRALYTSVVVAFGWAALRWWRGRDAERTRDPATGRIAVFAWLTAAAVCSAFPRADYTHVISVYPLVLVLLFALAGEAKGRMRRSAEAGGAFALLALCLVLTAHQRSFLTYEMRFENADMRVAPRDAWVESVVDFIDDVSAPDDGLLVYGHEAYYYFFARRFSSWPFAQLYPGQAGGDGGRALARLLIQKPPRVVLQGRIELPGLSYLPHYAPVLHAQIRALYSRDRSVFVRFPPSVGRPPGERAIQVFVRRPDWNAALRRAPVRPQSQAD